MADLEREGRFNRIRGKLKETWGGLTDDDITRSEGRTEQLIGRIKEKTGETSDTIREKLAALMERDKEETESGRGDPDGPA